VRRRTAKEELDESAPPATGETSAAAAEEVQRVRQQGKPAPPAAGETSEAAAVKPELLSRLDKSDPQMLPREFSGSANNTGWLHRQGSGNDSGTSPLRHPDGCRDGAVRQGCTSSSRGKEKRESRIATKNSNFKNSSFKTQLIEPLSI
jgi:hypothetical protein